MCQTFKKTSFADNRWSIFRLFYFSLVKVTRFLPMNFFFHRMFGMELLLRICMLGDDQISWFRNVPFSYFYWKNGESVAVNARDVQHAMAYVQLWQHNHAL